MDMFNKLKSSLSSNLSSTITNTVYTTGNIISGVLPGNPVTREYEVSECELLLLVSIIDTLLLRLLAMWQVLGRD